MAGKNGRGLNKEIVAKSTLASPDLQRSLQNI